MGKRKFRCEVERTDIYEIELDDEVMNGEWMEEFRNYFYDFDSLEEHAESIAQSRARFGGGFIEGYGNPLVNGREPFTADKDAIAPEININIVSEDFHCDVDVREIRD